MANEHNQYTPFIHLSTAITQAGSDMIERIGSLTAVQRYERRFEITPNPESSDWTDLRKAVKRAADALRNYDALIAANVEKSTSEQFNDAAEVL